MSDPNQTSSTASDPLSEAVAARNASAAPTDPVSQTLASLAARIDGIAAKVESFEPIVNAVADAAGAVLPQTHPVVTAFESLEGLFNDLIGSLHSHFGGKIALPEATGGTVTNTLKGG